MKTITGQEKLFQKAIDDSVHYENVADLYGVQGESYNPAISVEAQMIADSLKRLAEKFVK